MKEILLPKKDNLKLKTHKLKEEMKLEMNIRGEKYLVIDLFLKLKLYK